jgi:hypothetical protein
MAHFFRYAALVLVLCGIAVVDTLAQAPPLVFTVAVPERTSSETTVRASPVVAERGLALWRGASSDFGTGVDLAGAGWTIRSITSMRALPVGSHLHPTFQQIEAVRLLFSTGSTSVAGGGGIRQEWDGTRVLIGRVLGSAELAGGRLQGSFVMERSLSSPVRRDAADVMTSVGWSRRIGDRLALGVEGIGQDLEGFWDHAEADGGARLLVGPSLHVQTKSGEWAATATAGPVLRRPSTVSSPEVLGVARPYSAGHFAVFASASWLPSRR